MWRFDSTPAVSVVVSRARLEGLYEDTLWWKYTDLVWFLLTKFQVTTTKGSLPSTLFPSLSDPRISGGDFVLLICRKYCSWRTRVRDLFSVEMVGGVCVGDIPKGADTFQSPRAIWCTHISVCRNLYTLLNQQPRHYTVQECWSKKPKWHHSVFHN